MKQNEKKPLQASPAYFLSFIMWREHPGPLHFLVTDVKQNERNTHLICKAVGPQGFAFFLFTLTGALGL